MNRTERNMILEIHSLIGSIPNFKNNMDMEGYSSFRADSLQMQHFLKELTYSVLMFADKSEDKTYWKENFEQTLNDAKEFVEYRKKENWCGNSTYIYTVAVSGW
jgi:hypothetical protein